MPLTGTESVLSAAVSAEVRAKLIANAGGGEHPWILDNAALTVLCNAIGDGVSKVVAHFVSNAIVSPVGTPVPLTAPPGTAGGLVSGTGALV